MAEMINKTFAGITSTFADFDTAKILLQSIPYDGTSTWGKGADKGFEAFLTAAENMELYDIETDMEVYRQGIHIVKEIKNFASPADMFRETYKQTKRLLQHNRFLTSFGGEHSVSIGIIKAFYQQFEDLTVLQIDAHADIRSEYEGSPYNHACAVYDASKNCNLIQVGIRSMDISEKKNMDFDKVFFADEIKHNEAWFEESLKQMTENVYITFDLDAFDPSIMPATGTPEPGGLDWYTTTNYLRKVFKEKNVVGFDIVELAPIAGLSAPQFLAAKLYYKMLSYKFS
jgi:agmatinase